MSFSYSFLNGLKAFLPESSWSWVSVALRQDELVWKSLQNGDLAKNAIAEIGGEAKKWTPASLALLSLGMPLPGGPENFESQLRKRAIRAYEGLLRGQQGAVDIFGSLPGSCLLAIALLEHRRLSGSWHGMLGDLRPAPLPVWKTVLGCLFGLAPDRLKLLHSLVNSGAPREQMDLALHALLSNPAPQEEQAQILGQLVADLTMAECVTFLGRVEAMRPELAASVARHLLSKQPTFANRKRYQSSAAQIDYLEYLLSHGALHRFAGQNDQVLTLQSLAIDAAEHLQAQLFDQLLDATVQAGLLDQAVAIWKGQRTRPGSEGDAEPVEAETAEPGEVRAKAEYAATQKADMGKAGAVEIAGVMAASAEPGEVRAEAEYAATVKAGETGVEAAKAGAVEAAGGMAASAEGKSAKAGMVRSGTANAEVEYAATVKAGETRVEAAEAGAAEAGTTKAVRGKAKAAEAETVKAGKASAKPAKAGTVDAKPANEPPAQLVLSLLAAGRPSEAIGLYVEREAGETVAARGVYWLARAHQAASRGELSAARDMAKKALELSAPGNRPTQAGRNRASSRFENRVASLPFLRALAATLLDLSLPGHAVLAAKTAVEALPSDPDPVRGLAAAQRAAKDIKSALASAHLAVALAPDSATCRRELATSLEAAGEWEKALAERRALLDGRFNPAPGESWPAAADIHALASCAIRAGQASYAADLCRLALDGDPQDGLAHCWLGEALFSQGAHQEAWPHYEQGIGLAPHQAGAWLMCAHAQERAGNRAEAVETLRAACQAAPQEAAIYLTLGQTYLEDNALTQALACFRHAYEIVAQPLDLSRSVNKRGQEIPGDGPELMDGASPFQIAMNLGKTLQQLGHLPQAKRVLESAYHDQPAEPGLAHAYARILLETEAVTAALEPLSIAIEVQPEEVEPYLDYAAALLQSKSSAQLAVNVLRRALELAPGEARGLGLLAEALAANGDLEPALRAYYKALETRLSQDPAWRGRLSFGLGMVALSLGQPETAIAAFHEAVQVKPQDSAIHRAMAAAYTRLDLPEEALQSAQTAFQLKPDDLETILWFAEQAVELNALREASAALSQGILLEPEDISLQLRMGQIQSLAGDIPAARQTFHGILAAEAAGADHLAQTAGELLNIEDALTAVACLERAIAILPEPTTGLLRHLAQAFEKSGMALRALEALDQAIALDPRDAELCLAKVELLASLDRPEEAQACLAQGLEQNPNDAELSRRMSLASRARGEILAAFGHARHTVAVLAGERGSPKDLQARALAAELARALLETRQARSFLDLQAFDQDEQQDGQIRVGPSGKGGQSSARPAQAEQHAHAGVGFYCLAAELALEDGEEVAAATALTKAVKLDPETPRVLALQARLTTRRGDGAAASQTLLSLLECLGTAKEWNEIFEPAMSSGTSALEGTDIEVSLPTSRIRLAAGFDPISTLSGIAMAALDLGHWNVALYLLRQASALAPREPYNHLQLARTLVLRAEHQRLCHSLEVVAHAPGQHALAEQTTRSFEAAIEAAAAGLAERSDSPEDPARTLISRWQARGMAVLKPGTQSLQALEAVVHNPDDITAQIAAIGEPGDLASLVKESPPGSGDFKVTIQHHRYLVQLALTLGNQGRRQADLMKALEAAAAAIEQQPDQPLYHALYAYLAKRAGNIAAALPAIQMALSIWPDETRWRALAAELFMATGDPQSAIAHLSIATQREPKHLPHFLALAAAHQQNGDALLAIQAYEQARHLSPDEIETNLSLARAYFSYGELEQAARYADHAVRVGPNRPEAFLLRAEIALQSGEVEAALGLIQSAAQLQPKNAGTLRLQARALSKLNRTREALEVLGTALPLAEDPLPLLLERASLIETSQGPAAALGALEEVVAEYPEHPAVLASLATNYYWDGQADAAIQSAQKAVQTDGGELQLAERAGLHHMLGKLLRQGGQLDQAVHHLSEAMRISPDNVDPYLDLAGTQQERRQHTLALKTYQKACEVAPDDPRAYYQASLALKEGRDYQGAERMLRRAAELAPDDLAIHRQLAALVALNLVHSNRQVSVEA